MEVKRELMISYTQAGSRLNYSSFQANFYIVPNKPGRILKVYGTESLYGGLLDLSNPRVRSEVMERECQCLKMLAPEGRPAITQTNVDGKPLTAIEISKHDPSDFLDYRLDRGEKVGEGVVERIAERLADFHFHNDCCPQAEVSSMDSFLRNLINIEDSVLTSTFYPELGSKSNWWKTAAMRFLSANESSLEKYSHLVGPPIVGHGDIKSDNIVVAPNAILLFDSAPVPVWRINTRRMDADFFRTELELRGLTSEMDNFWSTYNELYYQNLEKKGLNKSEINEVKEINKILDMISRIYRLYIFLRLSHPALHNVPKRAKICEALLDEACAAIA